MATLRTIVGQFNGYSIDGIAAAAKEIPSLQFLWADHAGFDAPTEPVIAGKKQVLVLVESRLLDTFTPCRYTKDDLLSRLLVFKRDLARDGWQPRFLKMTPYSGPVRKDGKTLLAIREFLKAVRASIPSLHGVIMVGSFPQASIVRNWPQDCMSEKQYRVGLTPAQPRPFEIVLADLTGNWRDLYHEQINATGYVFGVTAKTTVKVSGQKVTLINPTITPTTAALRDVFLIPDAAYSISTPTGRPARVELDLKCVDPEVSAEDKTCVNPVARPDICVSRIDARMIAVQPPGNRLLRNGQPAAVSNTPRIDLRMEAWVRDPDLERTLLIDYFDRNHAFRSGKWFRQGAHISLIESRGLGMVAANEGLSGLTSPRDPDITNASVLDFVRWLKRPATLRAISSHADRHSTFLRDNDPNAATDAALVEVECGGRPWRWIEQNGQYVPSFLGHVTADLYVYRTLWENGVLAEVPPGIVLDVGCDVGLVGYDDTQHYEPLYGFFQNANGLLFYANQLAVLCRATHWNHGPFGFGAAFGASPHAVIGDGWMAVFDYIAQDAPLASQTTERKQCYLWSIVGDWTLRKWYAATTGPIDPHRGDGMAAIDPLALLLSNEIYVKIHLPDPVPVDVLHERVRKATRRLSAKRKADIVARARALRESLASIEADLQ